MRHSLLPPLLLAFGIGVMLLLAGCPLAFDSGTADLRLLITDKPYPVEFIASAEVTITRIDVRRVDFDNNNENSANENVNENNAEYAGEAQGEAFVTIFTGERSFDLLQLQNGQTDLVADAQIPAGEYDQMRLVVTHGRVVLTDGAEFELEVPSGEQSGIKLNFTFAVADGDSLVLLLDVDLSRAFQPIPGGEVADPGEITGFHFRPAYATRLINVLAAGSIAGTITDPHGAPLPDVLVTAYAGAEEVAGTISAADGNYQVIGLPAGTYSLEFSAPGYLDATAPDVLVVAGQQTAGVDVTLTPASAE